MAKRWTSPIVDHRPGHADDPYRNNFPAVPPTDDPNVWTNWTIDLPSYIQGDDIVVPPDHYFAMGDHRGVSLDSRYWGFIPKENVIGRPMFIYWSFETPDDQYRKTDWSDRVSFSGSSSSALLRETRWKRTLRSCDETPRTSSEGAVKNLLLQATDRRGASIAGAFALPCAAGRVASEVPNHSLPSARPVGRPVDIGSVHVRLLPRPGFDLENLVVYDDPAFGAEPMLRASEVTADLRLTSLLAWTPGSCPSRAD